MSRASGTTSAAASVTLPSSSSPEPDEDGPERPHEVDDAEVVEGQIVRPAPRPRQGTRRLGVEWQESRYTSPLPSPDDLERYKQLLPDAPERLLEAGEREQAHRHQLEDRLVRLDETAMPKFYAGQRRGHFVSLALALGYEAVMALAVVKGYAVAGVFGAAAGIGAMIWAIRRDTGPAEAPQVEEAGTPDHDDSGGQAK